MKEYERKEERKEKLLAERIRENTLAVQKMHEELRRKEKELGETRFIRGAGWKKSKVAGKPTLSISNETGGVAAVMNSKPSPLKEAVVTRKELRFRKASAVINKLEDLGELSQVRIFKSGMATQYQISEIGKDADGRIVITIDKLYETRNPKRNLLPFADNVVAVAEADDYFSVDYKEFCQMFNFIADKDVDVQAAQVDSLSHEFNIEKKGLVYNFERKEGKYE